MGIQGAQTNDQNSFQIGKIQSTGLRLRSILATIRSNDGTLQATSHLHQVGRDEELLGEEYQFDSRLYLIVETTTTNEVVGAVLWDHAGGAQGL